MQDAALLVAQGSLTEEEAAAKIGVHRVTLAKWKRRPEFVAMVRDYQRARVDKEIQAGIGERTQRVSALHDRWIRMKRVIEERAADPEMQKIPGGKTGLLCKTLKSTKHHGLVPEYRVDVGLLKEMREHERHAAIELGQWTDKPEGGEDRGDLTIEEMLVEYRRIVTSAPQS
ncbi:MAG TPA: hypothetical protein PLZ95_07715 [Bryobacteraceae bacterium]|nr:hypothetical protein [Bryobacteraceae bacterium]